MSGNLWLFQSRIVVPTAMRQMTLEKIHNGHDPAHTNKCLVSSVLYQGLGISRLKLIML